jgi:predicted permease
LAGAIPAWHASRADVITVLKDEGASGGARRARLRHLLVSTQVAVSVVLVVSAALLIGSSERALQGPGFDPANVITLRLRPSLVGYSRDRAHTFHRQVLDRLSAVPGVVSASPSIYMSMFSAGLRVAIANPAIGGEPVEAIGNAVGPAYFSTLGTRVLEGREFSDQDRDGGPLVAVINTVLARRLSPDRPAVGMTITANGESHTIVGVVGDAQYYVAGDAPRPQLFTSYWQTRGGDALQHDSRTFVKVAGDPAAMMAAVRRTVADVDPAVPVSEAHPLRERVEYMFQPVRMARLLLTASAALALLLCAVGLYGVLAFAVTERTREIGLRVAVGASTRDIVFLVARDAVSVMALGITAGLIATWNLTYLVESLLFGISSRDLATFAMAPLTILAVAALASYLPARRATRLSPLTALRVD